jgi:hypothetical protein
MSVWMSFATSLLRTNQSFSSNIATILQFNQNFCAKLGDDISKWNDQSRLGATFLSFTPYLKMYGVYISNNEASNSFYAKLTTQPRFEKIRTNLWPSKNDGCQHFG